VHTQGIALETYFFLPRGFSTGSFLPLTAANLAFLRICMNRELLASAFGTPFSSTHGLALPHFSAFVDRNT
jgi:hypothetical protein